MSLERGRLRHTVRIERYAELLDSNGETIQDPNTGEIARAWQEVVTVKAEVKPQSVREFVQSQATQSQISGHIVINYRDGLDAAMRLVHVRTGRPDVIYNPHGFLADPDSGLEYLTIPVSNGTGEGQ